MRFIVLREWLLTWQWLKRVGSGMLPHSGPEWPDGLGGLWRLPGGSQHCCLKTAVGRRGQGTKEMLCLS